MLMFFFIGKRSLHQYMTSTDMDKLRVLQKRGQFLIDSYKVQVQKSGGNLLRTKPVKGFPWNNAVLSSLMEDQKLLNNVVLCCSLDRTGAACRVRGIYYFLKFFITTDLKAKGKK